MHTAVQAQKYDDVGDEAAKEESTAGFFRRRNIVAVDLERLQDANGRFLAARRSLMTASRYSLKNFSTLPLAVSDLRSPS